MDYVFQGQGHMGDGSKGVALLRQRTGGTAGRRGDELGRLRQAQRARSVGLPQGRADAIADAHAQPHQRAAAASLAAARLTPFIAPSSIGARRQGGVPSRLRSSLITVPHPH